MKDIIMISLFGIAALLFSFSSYAGSYRTINNHYSTTNETQISNKGVALAIAKSQHNFDWSTEKWQGSVGVGSFDNEDAISFGMGKRLGKTLLNGSIGRQGGKYGYGVGVSWRF